MNRVFLNNESLVFFQEEAFSDQACDEAAGCNFREEKTMWVFSQFIHTIELLWQTFGFFFSGEEKKLINETKKKLLNIGSSYFIGPFRYFLVVKKKGIKTP